MNAVQELNDWVKANTSNLAILEVIEMWIYDRSSKQNPRVVNKFYEAALRNLQLRYDEVESRQAIVAFEGKINEFRRRLGNEFHEELEMAYVDYAWEPLWNQIETRVRRNSILGKLMIKVDKILEDKDLWEENFTGLSAYQRRSIIKALDNIREPETEGLRFDDLVVAGVYYDIPWNKTDGRKEQRYYCTQMWDEEDIWQLMDSRIHSCIKCDRSFVTAHELTEHQSVCGVSEVQRTSIDTPDIVVFEPESNEAYKKLTKIFSELNGYVKIQDNYLDIGIISLLNDHVSSGITIKLLTKADEEQLHRRKGRNFKDKRRFERLAKGLADIQKERPETEMRMVSWDCFHDRFIICESHAWISSTSLKDLGNENSNKISIMFRLPKQIQARVESVFDNIWNYSETKITNPDDIMCLVERL